MCRPFEGIRVIDATHVLAGPFAAYQLAVMGADVIKVENPTLMDQVREQGPDEALNLAGMGTYYLTQGANKRSVTLDLNQEQGRQLFKQLVANADVLIENYRAGAFKALGLGYDELSQLNEKLIYCSMTAFGQQGPRSNQTGYDMQIQATSGIMAATGTPEVNPIKVGPPVVDYATGSMGALAISSALFQREQTGRGQYIDLAMLDVALVLMGADATNYSWSGKLPEPAGNDMPLAGARCYQTKSGQLMVGAMNRQQHRRLFNYFGYPEIAAITDYPPRFEQGDKHAEILQEKLLTQSAAEWEAELQAQHIPAARVRNIAEALDDEQLNARHVTHQFENFRNTGKPISVPVAAFKFAHGTPKVDSEPPTHGQHTDEVLRELGCSEDEIRNYRQQGVI
ncbi:MAG: CaiB/BaiF CoA-transferase family protein [Pseudomonadota bacterium]